AGDGPANGRALRVGRTGTGQAVADLGDVTNAGCRPANGPRVSAGVLTDRATAAAHVAAAELTVVRARRVGRLEVVRGADWTRTRARLRDVTLARAHATDRVARGEAIGRTVVRGTVA